MTDTLSDMQATLIERQREKLREQQMEIKILTLKNSGSLANNLCPDCRDKQAGKPCLACTIQELHAELAYLKDRDIDSHNIMCNLEAKLSEKVVELSTINEILRNERMEKYEVELEIGKLREGLRKLEWSSTTWQARISPNATPQTRLATSCFICQGADDQGHKPDCWLSALLEEKR